MIPKHPSDDALTAVAGDTIHYVEDSGVVVSGKVREAFFQPSFKGGKVWSYKTETGRIVPNDLVTKVFHQTI